MGNSFFSICGFAAHREKSNPYFSSDEDFLISFWAQPTSKLEFHSTKVQKIKEEKMEKSLGLGKKSYGTETDTET
jgi:hypothetical protein